MPKRKGIGMAAVLRKRAAARRGGQAAGPLFPTAASAPTDASDALEACGSAWVESRRVLRYAEGTLERLRGSLRVFFAWAAERDVRRAGEVTRPMLEAFQRHLFRARRPDGRPLAWSTQHGHVACLQGLFRWLTRQNLILHNPASELELPRGVLRLPKASLSAEELARLLAVPDLGDPLGVRDRAILEVFYATGLRRAELCALECPDLNLTRGTLMVRQGKGSRDRVVPVGARASAWLRRYLDEVRPRLDPADGARALFLSAYGEGFHPDSLSRQVGEWLARAGLQGRGCCHVLRHTCATHMLEGGADVRYVQQLLGHASLDMTALYTQVTINRLLEVHARCHPGARAEPPTATP